MNARVASDEVTDTRLSAYERVIAILWLLGRVWSVCNFRVRRQ